MFCTLLASALSRPCHMQRQQPKPPQPKLDLATAHFPPLPTSSSSENGTTPSSAPPITSHSHTSIEDGPKTLSDIVRGSSARPISSGGNSAPSTLSGGPSLASSVVEKSLASAAAKVSATPGSTSPPQDTPPQPSVMNSDPAPSEGSGGGGDGGSAVVVVSAPPPPPASRVVTASSVVAGGVAGGASSGHQGSSSKGNRAPPPPPAPAAGKPSKGDSKVQAKCYCE